MSHPGMAGPTSARGAEAGFLSRRAEAVFAAEADPAVSVVLLMAFLGLMEGWIDGLLGQRFGAFSRHPIIQSSNNPVSCFGCG
jgi:hypothetical protein